MSAQSPCPVCTKIGLPVLPCRYVVVPDELEAGSLPFSGERVAETDAPGVKYATRILRQGFLYVFYEKNHLGRDKWQVYSLSADGKLHRQLDAASARHIEHAEACSRCGMASANKEFFVIEQPDKCETTWLAFSEHKWSEATVNRYQSDRELREKRMQPIEPAQWIAQATAENHQIILALPENLQAVIEYNEALGWNQAAELQPLPHQYDAPVPSANADGRFDVDWLKQRSTLYPWHMRNNALVGESGQRMQALHELMLAACGETAEHWPMGIALWDAIGVVHELNGFRNDSMGRFALYSDIHERHLHALQSIEAVKVAVEQGAQQRAERDIEAFTDMERDSYVLPTHLMHPIRSNTRDVDAARAFSRGYHPVRNDYGNRVIDLETYQVRRAALAAEYSDDPVALEAALAHDEESMTARRANLDGYREQRVADAWPRYEERIDRGWLNAFKLNFESLNAWRERIQGERTAALEAWLFGDLFLDTLEDYDQGNSNEDKPFNAVVEEAIVGLNGDPEGEAILQRLVDNTDPSDRASLVWRAMALNQRDAVRALKGALAEAERHHSTLAVVAGVFDTVASQLSTLASLYREYDNSGVRRVAPVRSQFFRTHGMDKLVDTVGVTIFKKWRVADVGDYVGEKIVQHVLAMRLGVDEAESKALVQEQLRHDARLRRLYLETVGYHQLQGKNIHEAGELAMAAVTADEGKQALQRRWASLRVEHSPKFASLIAICELFHFFKLAFTPGKKGADWALVGASALSTVAAMSYVMMGPLSAMLPAGPRTLRNWKAIGGGLAGGASFIQAMVDFFEGRDQRRQGYILVGNLMTLKGFMGAAVSGAFFVTALSSSSHLVQRLVGRNATVVVLGRIDAGIALRAAERRLAATAAGTAAHRAATREVAEAAARMGGQRLLYASIGRGVLMLVGWQATVAVIVVQVAIWYFTPNELERWLDKTPFGSKLPFNSLIQQQTEYNRVLEEMQL